MNKQMPKGLEKGNRSEWTFIQGETAQILAVTRWAGGVFGVHKL